MDRIKNAVTKSFSRVAICFSLSIIFVSIIFAFGNIFIDPVMMLKVWITFFLLGIFNVFRILVSTSKWALDKPYILPNLLFMPLFMITALALAMNLIKDVDFNGMFDKRWLLLIYAGLFLIIFSVKQFIDYYRYKAKTDLMNDALISFQKEHEWDEEE
ncbi:MAG: hypothetical protein J5517_07665 [Eubacterium sp.]|nr:hypothetical protein [Eubacterium sp.]